MLMMITQLIFILHFCEVVCYTHERSQAWEGEGILSFPGKKAKWLSIYAVLSTNVTTHKTLLKSSNVRMSCGSDGKYTLKGG